MNPGAGSLRELQTGFWGADVWEDMYETDVHTASKKDAEKQKLV